LEALREPLESGQITISRAAHQAAFPARFQLVAAMKRCPCGYLGAFAATGKTCRRTPDAIARYRTRLSGPLLDRIDLQVEVNAVRPEALMEQADGEDSASVALRVAAARRRRLQRQSMPNAALDAARIDTLCVPDAAASRFAQSAAQRLNWSSRGLHRAMKVARTIADLAGADSIATVHVAEAPQLRRTLTDATP
jgi:magnesium chelatase family protein